MYDYLWRLAAAASLGLDRARRVAARPAGSRPRTVIYMYTWVASTKYGCIYSMCCQDDKRRSVLASTVPLPKQSVMMTETCTMYTVTDRVSMSGFARTNSDMLA